MSEVQRPASTTASPSLYFTCRASPLVLATCAAYFDPPFGPSSLLIILLALADLFLTKEHFAPELVGLRWYFSLAESAGFPFVVFFSRPLPFVASTSGSHAFWMGLIVATILSFALAALLLFLAGVKWGILSGCVAVANLLNFLAFLKCKSASSEEIDTLARSILLDTTAISFQAVNEVDDEPDDPHREEEDQEIM
jgi:hypothetical protein